jgi:hypothetical protein
VAIYQGDLQGGGTYVCSVYFATNNGSWGVSTAFLFSPYGDTYGWGTSGWTYAPFFANRSTSFDWLQVTSESNGGASSGIRLAMGYQLTDKGGTLYITCRRIF